MSWYEPVYGYGPDEIDEELGPASPLEIAAAPAERPAVVYAGPFRPTPPAARPVPVGAPLAPKEAAVR